MTCKNAYYDSKGEMQCEKKIPDSAYEMPERWFALL